MNPEARCRAARPCLEGERIAKPAEWGYPRSRPFFVEGRAMTRTMMMIGASLLVAACGDRKSDIKNALRELASENAADMKEQIYASTMKSDLRNLMTAEEAYFQ